ncbi:MbnP family protein [Hymenobacter endophyticus]|uniref:MbnP family protein n=1 Tax=Hymenobacter endophyticus TaxID=3076335 RepID=A0ABU3TJ53_9BACT|nr:MbnP family protein [Hymenobacter endophyticus]MDU0371367.1 MbnP family protein [Hymenobacter endophyticus]
MTFRSFTFLLFASLATTLSACKDDADLTVPAAGTLDIEVDNVVGTAPLALNTGTYFTPLGQQFTVSTFNYYITNVKLKKADGTEYAEPESYHLVRETDAASKAFTLNNVPAGDYTALSFVLGVDSVRNVSGAQVGALDPANGMFWTWNSGYIYTKMEGSSPQAGGNRQLVFHIGGFKKPNNTICTVSPSLNGAVIQVRKDRHPTVHLASDVLKMFTGPNTINFTTLSNTMGGSSSVLVADNQAAGMFRVEHIHAN